MSATYEEGRFVNVIGTVDARDGSGELLYVNPTTSRLSPSAGAPRLDRVELVFMDADGQELSRIHPVERASTCEGTAAPSSYLVQEDVPRDPAMKSVALLVDGVERSRFEAGPAISAGKANAGLTLGAPSPARPNRQPLSVDAQTEPGVSYVVEAKREGGAWQTLAVGRETPEVQLDWNQFAGAAHVDVRVTRSTGFDETVIAQERLEPKE